MKKSLAAALIAALAVFALIGVSAAAGDDDEGPAAKAAAKAKRGKRGPRGPRGPQGPQGPAGIGKIVRADGPVGPQGGYGSGSEVGLSVATCPAGYYVTGGGFEMGSVFNYSSYEKSSPTQYSVIAVNENGSPNSVTAHAICAGGPALSAASSRSKRPTKALLKRAAQLQEQVDAKRGGRGK